MRNILPAILGAEGVAAIVILLVNPQLFKVVLTVGILSLIGLFAISKQGKFSIFGSHLFMCLAVVLYYA